MPEGNVDDLTRIAVSGWALDRADPERRVEVLIRLDGQEVARFPAAKPRRFGNKAAPGGTELPCGFQYRFDPPLSLFRQHRVEVRFADGGKPLPGGVREFTCPAFGPMARRPVIVNARGRSGTTLLMKEFLGHPDFVVADVYPYEVKLASYYVSAYRVLAGQAAPDRDPGFVAQAANKALIGRNPFNEAAQLRLIGRGRLEPVFEGQFNAQIAALFRTTIESYYDEVAEAMGRKQAAFFAEKAMLDEELRAGLRMLLGPLREIIMVRDPRDLLCSAKSFWKMNEQEALRTVFESVEGLTAIRAQAAEDTLIVRYEDLIEQPEASRAAIYQFIGTEPPPAAAPAAEMETLRRKHATTRDPRASIGRWREELSQDEILACLDHFDGFLRAFGYLPPDSAGEAPPSASKVVLRRLEPGRLPQAVLLNGADGCGGAALAGAQKVQTLHFTTGGNGAAALAAGWSAVEREFAWSKTASPELHLPVPAEPGAYLLELYGRPFLAGGRLARQRVTISVNGVKIGQGEASGILVLRCLIPAYVVALASPMVVRFDLPDAVRPADVLPDVKDARMLGIAAERLTLYGPLAA